MRLARQAPRGGMNQINLPPHEFREGTLGTVFRIVAQKLLVG
jgi:hypothetical protein